jgi:hypothetical protein
LVEDLAATATATATAADAEALKASRLLHKPLTSIEMILMRLVKWYSKFDQLIQ